MVDPTLLNINTRVIPQVMSVLLLLNVSARSPTVNDTVKKSNASQVHAMKATRKNIHCWKLNIISSLMGLGALAIGGLRVVSLVAAYLPGLM
jgi:hypothetical protein